MPVLLIFLPLFCSPKKMENPSGMPSLRTLRRPCDRDAIYRHAPVLQGIRTKVVFNAQ